MSAIFYINSEGEPMTPEDAEPENTIFNLLTDEGSLPASLIAARIGKTENEITNVVHRCEWFELQADGDIAIAKS